tara:strand:- start:1338 stop:1721 length:384 start_codon:yes stop_codon:yes gene_type:complete
MSSEYEKLDAEYARKHWVSQEVHGYPTPSEIRHRWRLKLMDWKKFWSWKEYRNHSSRKWFWDWGWMVTIIVLGVSYLTISLSGCATVEKTNEERREAWYQACIQTSTLPDASAESCRWRADKIKYGD